MLLFSVKNELANDFKCTVNQFDSYWSKTLPENPYSLRKKFKVCVCYLKISDLNAFCICNLSIYINTTIKIKCIMLLLMS